MIVLLVTALAASCGKKGPKTQAPDSAEAYLKRAKGHFTDTDAAIKDAGKAIALDEHYLAAYEFRAEMYEVRYRKTKRPNDVARALADYDKLVALESDGPKTGEWLGKRGWLKLRAGNYDGAIADLKASLDKDRHNPRTYRRLARAYLAKNDHANAAKACSYAIKYDPNDASLYVTRSEIYYAMKKYEEAIADLGKVIELQPDYLAYARRAELYREIGQPQKAIDDYEKARSLNPEFEAGGTVW